jgi:hypothetical protein
MRQDVASIRIAYAKCDRSPAWNLVTALDEEGLSSRASAGRSELTAACIEQPWSHCSLQAAANVRVKPPSEEVRIMETSPHLQDFLAYLEQGTDLKPEHQFWARVALADTAPTFSYTLPRGEVILYPQFLVFLTTSKDAPGANLMLKEAVQMMAETYKTAFKLNKWVTHPATLLFEVAKWLSRDFRNENTLASALINPNSIYVPVGSIRDAIFVKGIIALRPHHVKVKLDRGTLVIYQDPMTENQFKSLLGQFSGKWQEDFLVRIKAHASAGAAHT